MYVMDLPTPHKRVQGTGHQDRVETYIMRRQKKIQINFLEIFDIFERFFFKNKNELIAFMG